MLYILTGEDDFSLTRALDEIKNETGDPAALAMGTTMLDGKEVTPEHLRTICETVPFMSGKRLVIVEGLLARFNPQNRPRRQTRTKQANDQADKDRLLRQAEDRKKLVACFEKLPDSTIVALIESKIAGANPLFKELTGKATIKTFPPLKEAALNKWAQSRVTAEGGSIAPKALTLLTRLVGSDLWAMTSEIDKLIIFAKGHRIEEEDVKTLVGYAEETTVFVMIDAILNFKAELAEQSLQKLLQSGSAPAQLLTMLARQVQLMVRAKDLKSKRTPNTEIQSKLGIPNEFIFRKTVEQASRFSLPRLREVYHHILETDLSIKTGRYDAELALTILVAELGQRGRTQVKQTVS
ncbi:MAG: DNA polymerase III subunit delta [Chloroflexota bacterium]